ncbi:ankyrin [Lojkania enalia]|uniref:Ankyrin n=1 Tax=Lojkania enalia TaxID=147567 RepID=A0A9P4KGA1_9PLEO|nr:ankyrin [Didymosphaeria enalia]
MIARTLLEHPMVYINHVDQQGRSLLSWAAGEGFLRAMKMILDDLRVDFNLKDFRGRSPLLWVADCGQGKAIDVLIQNPVHMDRFCKDVDHRSALSLACGKGHTEMVKALIKYRCWGVDEKDVDGWTPLA